MGNIYIHLRFADDIMLVSHDPDELQRMSIKKTKVMMSNNPQDKTITTVDGTTTEKVNSYITLVKKHHL